jgi:pyruvate/2-oxoglutarate/acetoin dehydrogenase E1 component
MRFSHGDGGQHEQSLWGWLAHIPGLSVVVPSNPPDAGGLIVDEDYEGFGLSGELAAVALQRGLVFKYTRVCTQTTIPYARHLEDKTLPSGERIVRACKRLIEQKP